MTTTSLQQLHAPESVCFGCGPANPQGLQLQSFVEGEAVVAHFTPAPHHTAFPGVLNGGIIGTLLDCHSNWTAAYHLMQSLGLQRPPVTVTAAYGVTLLRPTPLPGEVELRATVVESSKRRAVVEATLKAGGELCASCRGTFVAVKDDHPAAGQW